MSTAEPNRPDQTELHQQLYSEGDVLIDRIRQANAPGVYIISGPSGVGKDSVIDHLREELSEANYLVTATTRPMREGEIDGTHYIFMTREDFLEGIENDAFIEHAEVYGNHYGVPRKPIEDGLATNHDVIIKVDVKGADTLRRLISNTVSIFLAPESMVALHTRLRDRKTEDPKALAKRFRTASQELAEVKNFDYVVFNEEDALDAAVQSIIDIVQVERLKVNRPEITLP